MLKGVAHFSHCLEEALRRQAVRDELARRFAGGLLPRCDSNGHLFRPSSPGGEAHQRLPTLCECR
eukprot:4285953-Alexandrium_andersonii.AAC.1